MRQNLGRPQLKKQRQPVDITAKALTTTTQTVDIATEAQTTNTKEVRQKLQKHHRGSKEYDRSSNDKKTIRRYYDRSCDDDHHHTTTSFDDNSDSRRCCCRSLDDHDTGSTYCGGGRANGHSTRRRCYAEAPTTTTQAVDVSTETLLPTRLQPPPPHLPRPLRVVSLSVSSLILSVSPPRNTHE